MVLERIAAGEQVANNDYAPGRGMLLEVIACSVRDAIEAQEGGAGRLELVRELGRGGLTPQLDLVAEVVERVTIPIRVMIREADGYAAGTAHAVERLARLANRVASLGVDGVVVGFLDRGGIDVAAMQAVLAAAAPVRVTFHHAFDELPDPIGALQALRRWPAIDRVLTSGGVGDWNQKAARLREWTDAAQPDMRILAGGGIDLKALRILARAGLPEAHTARAARVPPTVDGAVSSHKVAALVAAGCERPSGPQVR
jgi:copper homeostasis protein